jgi:hypothetical protein
MTRLVCLYNKLDPRTEASVRRFAPACGLEPEWADTSATLQTYAAELEKRWDGQEDLIVVEQDKELHQGCLPELLACAQPWCAYVFWINPVPHTTLVLGGFGVTRFSREIQRLVKVSDFAGEVQHGIDRRFYDHLLTLSIPCHLHGYVQHHHVYEPRPFRVRHAVQVLRREGVLPPAMYPEPAAPHLLPGSYDLAGG